MIVEKREQLAKSPVSSAIVSGAITRPVTALASVAASAGVSAGPSDRRQRDAEGPSARRQHDEGIRGDSGPSKRRQYDEAGPGVRRSIAFLGRNGCGKSFLINLALQVRSKWVYLLKRDPLPDSHRCFDPPSSNDQPDKKHDKQFSR